MPFTPAVNLTYYKRIPTLNQLSGTYKTDDNKHRAWAVRLNLSDQEKQQLVQQAIVNGVVNGLPTFTGNLSSHRDRFKAFGQSLLNNRVAHGWDARLNRPNPSASTGTIVPTQLRVTPEKVTFPGTDTKLKTRVIALFETRLNADGTLAAPAKIGDVNCFELGGSFLLFRKAEPSAADEAGAPPNAGADTNKNRILVIDAHGEEPAARKHIFKGRAVPITMPIPDNVALSYGVPSGYDSICESQYGESQIGVLAKELPRFASIDKSFDGSELAIFNPSARLNELMTTGGALQNHACDAKDLMRLAAGTASHGRVANTLLVKFHNVRSGDSENTGGTPIHPIVYTRGGDTYDQVAFAALNTDKVDIVTIREGVIPRFKSDLIKALDKLGVLSQYDEIYDPSCRKSVSTPPATAPGWRLVTHNRRDPSKPDDLCLQGKKAADGTRNAAEISFGGAEGGPQVTEISID